MEIPTRLFLSEETNFDASEYRIRCNTAISLNFRESSQYFTKTRYSYKTSLVTGLDRVSQDQTRVRHDTCGHFLPLVSRSRANRGELLRVTAVQFAIRVSGSIERERRACRVTCGANDYYISRGLGPLAQVTSLLSLRPDFIRSIGN